MLLLTFIGASALLSAVVEAAPKANQFSGADARRGPQGFRPVFGRALNRTLQYTFTNSSTSSTSSHSMTETAAFWNKEALATIECPTASVLISTTTVDVTVYVTATSNLSYTAPYHNAGSAPHTKLGPLYSNVSTDCDTETAPVRGGYKTAAPVKDLQAAETPCTDKPIFPTNGTFTRSLATPITRVQTRAQSTDEPCTDEAYLPANKTLVSLRTPDFKFPSTTLSIHTPLTTPCNETVSSKPSFTYTPAGNFSTPQAKVVPATTTPCANSTTSSTPTSHSSTVYILPFANATTPLVKAIASASTTPRGYSSIAYAVPTHKVTPKINVKAPISRTLSSFKTSPTPVSSNTTATATNLYRAPILPFGNNTTPSASSTPTTTKAFSVTPFLSTTATPTVTATSETCIIDTSITPVSVAAFNYTRTYTPAPKTTLYQNTVEDGTPRRNAAYCGVHGRPAGTYFIAQYIEQRSGVPVSLEGCYQFCNSTAAATRGCQAYRYYLNDAGAPRCDLYGMPVSRSVYDIDATQPSVWYDLTCGSPSTSNNTSTSTTSTGNGTAGGISIAAKIGSLLGLNINL